MRSFANGNGPGPCQGASNSQGTGGFEYDVNTGRADPWQHWWLQP